MMLYEVLSTTNSYAWGLVLFKNESPSLRFFASIVTKPIRTIGRKNELEVWGFDAVYLSLPKTEENRSWLLVSGTSQVK